MSELLGDKEGNSFQTLRIVSHKYDDSCTGGVAQTALPEGQSRFFEPPVVTTVDVSSSSFGLGGCLRWHRRSVAGGMLRREKPAIWRAPTDAACQ